MELHEDFRLWLIRNPAAGVGYVPGASVFGSALGQLGVAKRRKRGITYYLGIALKT